VSARGGAPVADARALLRAGIFAAAAAATCALFLVLDAPAGAAATVVLAAALATVMRAGLGLKLLVLFAPLAPLEFMPHALFGVRGLNPFNSLFALAAASYVLASLLGREPLVRGRTLVWPAAVFAVLILVLTLRSLAPVARVVAEVGFETTPGGFFRDTVLRGWQFLLLGFLVAFESRGREDALRFLSLMAASAAIFGGFYLVVFFAEWFRIGSIDATRRVVGKIVSLNVNRLAALFTIPMSLGLALYSAFPARSHRRWFWLSIAALSFFVVVFTFSRSGYAAAAFLLTAYLWHRSRPAAVLLPVLLLLLPMWLISPIFERIAYGLGTGSANAILTGRLNGIWLPLLPDFFENPLLGQGRYAILFSTAAKSGVLWSGLNDPHCAYLELLLDGGIVGLAGVLFFYAAALFAARKLYRASADPFARRFSSGLSLAIVAYAIGAATGLSFYPVHGNVFLWPAIGVLAALVRIECGAGKEAPS